MLPSRLMLSRGLLAFALLHLATSSCFSSGGNASAQAPGNTDLSGTAEFSLELFKTLFKTKADRNIFFSPYSIWSAFMLAYFGSAGNTEAQLRKVLRVPGKAQALSNWRAREALYTGRASATEYTFRLANRAYFDQSVALKPCVTKTLSSEVRVADMGANLGATVSKEINGWVENVTNNAIKDLVSAADVAQARMALVNAAYFKGTWASQFKKSDTKKQIFYSSRKKFSMVPMMTQTGNFRSGISEELGAHILELPYNGDQISMVVMLPPFFNGDHGFDEMIKRLNASTLKKAMNSLYSSKVEVTLPKFKLEEQVGNELMDAMMDMGVTDLFRNANLSDFSASTGLNVGKSIHKAFVEVSEEGTEAAAATVLISFRVARPIGPSKFLCNHPFLFMIYDHSTTNILFMGAYKSPKSKKM